MAHPIPYSTFHFTPHITSILHTFIPSSKMQHILTYTTHLNSPASITISKHQLQIRYQTTSFNAHIEIPPSSTLIHTHTLPPFQPLSLARNTCIHNYISVPQSSTYHNPVSMLCHNAIQIPQHQRLIYSSISNSWANVSGLFMHS